MIDAFLRHATDQKIKMTIVPYRCLSEIQEEIIAFAQRDDLNIFQKSIATERYIFNPQLDFTPKFIIIAATPIILFNAVFSYKSEKYSSEIDIVVPAEQVLNILTQGNSYHFFYDYWLPQKRLAVRSGLAEYGKNNICYVKEFGSLITLFAYISDMPCPDDYTWHEVKNMEQCSNCKLCQQTCPTGAIKPDRFLIDNEKCLSSMNEWGSDPFPDFIPKQWCYCTLGYTKQLFDYVLSSQVNVELIESIKAGGSRCAQFLV